MKLPRDTDVPSSDEPTIVASTSIGRGTVLGGKYEVEQVLGEGGMGVVVAAKHLQLGRRVALKFLLPAVAAEPETVERFLREAQMASQIASEHVTRVLDVGTLDNGAPFMVMELLEGRDLGAVLAQRGALPVSEVVDLVLQALEALAEAHVRGIVHRDLKPSNLFLTHRPDGSPFVKVLDFGLSKSLAPDRHQKSLTRSTSGALGSPLYMAPEQVRSAKNASYPSDVWSIGVMLYELLTNDVPFDADSIPGLLASIVADSPKPLRVAKPTLPAGLESVVMQCLQKDPSRRPDIGTLASGLGPFATSAGATSVNRISALMGRREQISPRVPAGFDVTAETTTVRQSPTLVSGSPNRVRSLWNFTSDPTGVRTKKGALLLGGSLIGLVGVAFAASLLLRSPPGAASSTDSATTGSPSASPEGPEATGAPASPAPPDASGSEVIDPPSAPSTAPEASATPLDATPRAPPSAAAPTEPPPSASAQRARPPGPRKDPAPSATPAQPSVDDLVKKGRR